MELVVEQARQLYELKTNTVQIVDTPNGLWKMRTRMRLGKTLVFTATSPTGRQFHSLKAILIFMKEHTRISVPVPHTCAFDEHLATVEPHRLYTAASILTQSVRVRQYQMRTIRKRSEVIKAAREGMRIRTGVSALPMLRNLPFGDPLGMTLTYDMLVSEASSMLADRKSTKLMLSSARAVRYTPDTPTLHSYIPLFFGTRLHAISGLLVTGASCVSSEHGSLLCDTFGKEWHQYMQQVTQKRPSVAYDMFGTDRTFVGGLVLTKFCAETPRGFVPVLHIDSVVLVPTLRHMHNGTKIRKVLMDILFADVHGAEYGIIFAQCVSSTFWDWLDIGNMGKCLIFQMAVLYDDYDYEQRCTMRSARIEAPPSTTM